MTTANTISASSLDPKAIKVSDNFSLDEILHSDKADANGWDNTPSLDLLIIAVRAAQEMQRVRRFLNSPISVSSWYRSPQLNTSLGSKSTSQHLVGEAIDFKCPGFGSPVQIVKALVNSPICFDQLILEHSWVHISFAIRTGSPKREVLSLLANGHYASGITDLYGKPI